MPDTPTAPAWRIAVFAGTAEGHELLGRLSVEGLGATAFVATEYGAELICDLPGIEVRQGRLDAQEMREALGAFDVVVDATHPYATIVSANLREAAAAAGVRYVRLLRPSTLGDELSAPDAPRVVEVADPAEAARRLAELEGNVLVTTGSKDLDVYAGVPGFEERLFVRILPIASGLERALGLGYPAKHVICMQGPFSRDLNVAMLRQVGARWLLTKDTGVAGGLPEKLSAAHEAGCGVVLIRRPDLSERGYSLDEVVGLLTCGQAREGSGDCPYTCPTDQVCLRGRAG